MFGGSTIVGSIEGDDADDDAATEDNVEVGGCSICMPAMSVYRNPAPALFVGLYNSFHKAQCYKGTKQETCFSI
jgi:hypothetical protein